MDGVRLVPPARLRELSAVAVDDIDQVMNFRTVEALGYGIDRIGTSAGQTPTVFGMGGSGGSYAYADTATRTAFALNKNRLQADFCAAEKVAGIVAKAVEG